MVELGWVEQFRVDNNRVFWNNWLPEKVLRTKLQYRF